ncbi:MAG: hypothetical protein H7288_07130 [Kineosporiaceae bacterium]|nr:hypothetical protein [Aeromicrobium sp.]
MQTSRINGKRVFRFELAALSLGQGQYFVHASYGTLSDGELFRIPQAAAFSVSEETNNVGVMSAIATGSLVAASGAHSEAPA